MSSPLHVLVAGSIDSGVCDFYRLGMYASRLTEHDVEVRPWIVSAHVPRACADDPLAALQALQTGEAVPDLTPIEWADVLVFRRTYATSWVCGDCDVAGPDRATAETHCTAAGHRLQGPSEPVVRALVDLLDRDPAVLRGRALMYETDDDLLSPSVWNNLSRRLAPERDLIERVVRRADLVTTTTPVIAGRLRRFTDAVRVIRNAVDPAWYQAASPPPDLAGDPRLLFYGGPERIGHYNVCRAALDAVVGRHPRARRVWLGSDRPFLSGVVDEVRPYVAGVPAFARALVEARPDVGLAPVLGDKYDLARSELHWLEYSLAGAATVASRTPFGGPYDVIRDGVDGLLAGSPREWRRQLERIVASRTLREELAGRARERVLAEYDVRDRAAEWADAYRWAAEHAGRASQGRRFVLGSPELRDAEPAWHAALVRRQAERAETDRLRAALETARAGRAVCWPPEAGQGPLVTVVVPVAGDRAALTLPEALRSALTQAYPRVEVVVVLQGVGAPVGQAARMLAAADPRVRVVDGEARNIRGSAPGDVLDAVLDAALHAARGAWIAPLPPDVTFTPDHLAALVATALAVPLEYVAGELDADGGQAAGNGSPAAAHDDEPPVAGTQLWAAALQVLPPGLRPGIVPDAGWWMRARAAGLRVGRLQRVVTTRATGAARTQAA